MIAKFFKWLLALLGVGAVAYGVYYFVFRDNESQEVCAESVCEEGENTTATISGTPDLGEISDAMLSVFLDMEFYDLNVNFEVTPVDMLRAIVHPAVAADGDAMQRVDRALCEAERHGSDVDGAVDAFLENCSTADIRQLFDTSDSAVAKEHILMKMDDMLYGVEASLTNRMARIDCKAFKVERERDSNRVHVEIRDIDKNYDEAYVLNILQSVGQLEFWATCDYNEVYSIRQALVNTDIIDDNLLTFGGYDCCVGVADKADMETVSDMLAEPSVKSRLPYGVKLAWENKSVDGESYGDFRLVALKGTAPLMDGGGIIDASAQYDSQYGGMVVSLSMNGDAAKQWEIITANNVGKSIAIVMDGVVYSAPNVNEPIAGGQSQISGGFSVQEAESLAAILRCGAHPVAVRCIDYETIE